MTRETQLAAVSELSAEIARLGDTIAFCQGQILRKQIAIAQLMDREAAGANEPCTLPDLVTKERSVQDILREVRPVMNGRPFKRHDLLCEAMAAFPREAVRIQQTIRQASAALVATGDLVRNGPWLRWRDEGTQ